MTVDNHNNIMRMVTHVQQMVYHAKQAAMDGSNWHKLLDELEAAAKFCVPVANAMRQTSTRVYLVSDGVLPDDVMAYDNEEGANQCCWDRQTLGDEAVVTELPLLFAPSVTMTTGRE